MGISRWVDWRRFWIFSEILSPLWERVIIVLTSSPPHPFLSSGIIGFVRFTSGFYMTLCTKRSVVGLLGGHYIFHCDETIMLPISAKMEKTHEETRLLNMFQGVDLSKNFYFSYSYDLTNTLQVNLTRRAPTPVHNTHFMWNFHLLQRAFGLSEGLAAEDLSDRREMKVEETEDGEEEENRFSNWVLPLIHGFVDQASESPPLTRSPATPC